MTTRHFDLRDKIKYIRDELNNKSPPNDKPEHNLTLMALLLVADYYDEYRARGRTEWGEQEEKTPPYYSLNVLDNVNHDLQLRFNRTSNRPPDTYGELEREHIVYKREDEKKWRYYRLTDTGKERCSRDIEDRFHKKLQEYEATKIPQLQAGISKKQITTIPELITYIKNIIIRDNYFQNTLEQAQNIQSILHIGIGLCSNINEKVMPTDDAKVYMNIIRIAFETAKESLSESQIEISISSEKSKEIRKSFFDIFNMRPDLYPFANFLVKLPAIEHIKSSVLDILENENQIQYIRNAFRHEFNAYFEERISQEQEISNYLQKVTEPKNRAITLIKHLEKSKNLINMPSKVDNLSISDYYLENLAIRTDMYETWHKEDEEFLSEVDAYSSQNKGKISNAMYLVMDSVKKTRFTVIAATFGIGKTSLSKFIASSLARSYLDDQDDEDKYIPIFVALHNLEKIAGDENGIVKELKSIASGQQARKKKIVVICDGLDEYGPPEDIKELKLFLGGLTSEDKYPNIRFIITTRLEAGTPNALLEKEDKDQEITSDYIRLLPFSKTQVDEFFCHPKFNLPNYNHDNLVPSYLDSTDIRKPLFCWMFTLMAKSGIFNQQEIHKLSLSDDRLMKRALVYQGFIYSILRGKHKTTVDTEYSVDTEYFNSGEYFEEKQVLRKVAALKQMCNPQHLTEDSVVDNLLAIFPSVYNKYKDDANKNKESFKKDHLGLLLTTYFYLVPTGTRERRVDFIHKSFGEYLLAEFYIESICNYKKEGSLHLLNIGTPSKETISFFEGLLKLLLNYNNQCDKQIINNFLRSLSDDPALEQNNLDLTKVIGNIVTNAKEIFSNEVVITFSNQELYKTYGKEKRKHESNYRLWKMEKLPTDRYQELWIHRWLSLFALDVLLNRQNAEKEIRLKLEEVIRTTAHNIPSYLKRLTNRNLLTIPETHLRPDLLGSDMTEDDIYRQDLDAPIPNGPDFSSAILSGANLSGADLIRAKLSRADLSGADLSGADLSSAKLNGADLSGADLSGANLSRADLSRADLSRANLSRADLSGANLSRADLSGANLSRAKLSRASLEVLSISKKEAKARGAIIGS
jgi:uncharacterized protein YjbI with pentapeptide repeats